MRILYYFSHIPPKYRQCFLQLFLHTIWSIKIIECNFQGRGLTFGCYFEILSTCFKTIFFENMNFENFLD